MDHNVKNSQNNEVQKFAKRVVHEDIREEKREAEKRMQEVHDIMRGKSIHLSEDTKQNFLSE